MASDYDCPYCPEVAVRLTDDELVEGKRIICKKCKRRSRLAHVPQPTATNLDTRVWVLLPDEE